MSPTGEVAIVGRGDLGTQIVTLDAAGEPAIVRVCTAVFVDSVAIDAFGAVYVGGREGDRLDAWAAVFD